MEVVQIQMKKLPMGQFFLLISDLINNKEYEIDHDYYIVPEKPVLVVVDRHEYVSNSGLHQVHLPISLRVLEISRWHIYYIDPVIVIEDNWGTIRTHVISPEDVPEDIRKFVDVMDGRESKKYQPTWEIINYIARRTRTVPIVWEYSRGPAHVIFSRVPTERQVVEQALDIMYDHFIQMLSNMF